MRYIDVANKFKVSSVKEGRIVSYSVCCLSQREYKMIARALKTMDAIDDVIDEELELNKEGAYGK